MAIVEFFPLDIDAVEGPSGRIRIRLFGRTMDGKRVCAIDDGFEPYFYVVPTATQHVKQIQTRAETMKFRVGERLAYTTKTAIVTKQLLGEALSVVKIFVNHPKDIAPIAQQLNMLKEVKEVYETDLSSTKRYLLDKQLTPLVHCMVGGEEMEANVAADIIVSIKSIKQTEGTFIKNPRILGVDIEVATRQKQPDANKDPIVMLAFYGTDGFSKVITWKPFANPKKHILFVKDEGELLLQFKETIQEYKPDYLVGYYSDGFDLPYLRTRADKYAIPLQIGMDKRNIRLTKAGILQSVRIKGIVHIDIFKFIKRIMKESLHVEEYDLDTVSKTLLGEGKLGNNVATLAEAWDNDVESLRAFCDYNLQDARLAFKLTNILLPHLNEITKLIRMPLYDISRMTYGQLVENYLLTHLTQLNELIPNKPPHDTLLERKTASYTGGFVYEPQAGFYNNVVVFDFKGLYPSILTAHNICPSTLTEEKIDAHPTPPITINNEQVRYAFNYKRDGFLPQLVKDIIERRNRIKAMTKGEEVIDPLLKAREHTLKLLTNSIYGYLAYPGARWYSLPCAAAISAYGRDYITKVIKQARTEQFQIIYSDTDSIFLSLRQGKTKKDALLFLRDVNNSLPSLMELEYEGFYPRGLFVMKKTDQKGAKKKYALLDEEGKIKIVGFETVRGDWSVLAKEVQEYIIQTILQGGDKEKVLAYVKEVIKQVKEGAIPLAKMVIKKQVKKALQDYENIGPHVAVAKKLKAKGEAVAVGTVVNFVISAQPGSISEKAQTLEDCKAYDVEYYINNQIIPVVERILDVLGYPTQVVLDEQQSRVGDF